MKIFFDNVNLNSSSGPNSFAKKIKSSIEDLGHEVCIGIDGARSNPDIQLSFIASSFKVAPIVQRLDGIYFNSIQNFNELNEPIEATYSHADAVIYQTDFNKDLTNHYFGVKERSYVIRNGTNLSLVDSIEPMKNSNLDKFENVWTCASSWRPHKRLKDNIDYFLEFAPESSCFVIAGSNPDVHISHPNIFYAGSLDWKSLISLYKRSSHFIHLSWLDHCPNVVVDARAAGCHIVCSSAGGTIEIAGKNSTIIVEDDWDFSPVELYSPPAMDFKNTSTVDEESDIDIESVAKKYIEVFEGVLS